MWFNSTGKFGRIKSVSSPSLNVYASSTAGCSHTDHQNHRITDCVTEHADLDGCDNFLAQCHPAEMNNAGGSYRYPGYPHQFTSRDRMLLLSEQWRPASRTNWGTTVLESERAGHLQTNLAALDLVAKNGLRVG